MVNITVTQRLEQTEHTQTLLEAGINPLLAKLWSSRGIALPPPKSLSELLDPLSMKDIQKAANILADMIRDQKRILVVADYDCDGATACAVAVRGLRMMGAHVDFFVPSRFDTGYGLSPEAVDRILEYAHEKPDLLLTVDNGIASVSGVAYAKQKGIEVLVTDHHLPGDQLPDALAIVNPNQMNCPFPSKNLAGCGVMFYVLLALRAELRTRGAYTLANQPNLSSLLDIVALGTVADVVKLDENNRLLVAHGLKLMRHHKAHEGIKALFKVANANIEQASAMHLGFFLGPRINAAGRLADMELGIRLLLSDDEQESLLIAQELNQHNQKRRHIEIEMRSQAQEKMIEADTSHATITVHDPDWHEGVIGIVASRLKDAYWKPTLVFANTTQEGILKGSGRSVPDVHLRDALDLVAKRLPHAVISFGGHAMAAGISIHQNYLEDFSQAFSQAVIDISGKHNFTPEVETDGPLPVQYATYETAKLLQQEVWGSGFPAPIFYDQFEVMSQTLLQEKHLKLKLQKDGQIFDAIWFNHGEALNSPTRLVYEFVPNEWNNCYSVQLMIRYEHHEPLLSC